MGAMWLLSKRCHDCGVPLSAYDEARYFCKVCRRHSCEADHHICEPTTREHKYGAVNYEQVLGGGFMPARMQPKRTASTA